METGLEMELDKTEDTDEREALEDKLVMLSELQMNLDQFYTDTSVKSLREKRKSSTRWKATKAHKSIFGPARQREIAHVLPGRLDAGRQRRRPVSSPRVPRRR